MTVVLDASAVLALLQDEPAADHVLAVLGEAVIPAPAWSETVQKVRDRSGDHAEARATLLQLGVHLEVVDDLDAEEAARIWRRGAGLSLADRFCIAVGRRLDVPIWTCDHAWADVDPRVVILR